MSADLETRLRTSLRQRAEDPVPVRSDVVGRFRRDERSHVAFRRVRRGGVAAVLLSSAAALFLAIPLPDALPAVRVGPSQDAWVLAQGPVRGSLATDTGWLDGMRRHVAATFEDRGWRVAKPRTLRVVYAGDTGRARVALVVFTVRRGPAQTSGYAWYEGRPGAAPQDMVRQGYAVGSEPPEVATDLTLASVAPGGDALVVVAPRGARFSTSPALRFGADGRVHRDWTPAPTGDGTLVLPQAATPGEPVVSAVRVTVGADVTVVRTEFDSRGSFEMEPFAARVRAALDRARGVPGARRPSLDDAGRGVENALAETHLPVGTTPFAIPWTGTIGGFPAFLVTVTPPGGGTLVYSFRRTDDVADHGTLNELRLLVPAQGATVRPLLWRLRTGRSTETDGFSDDVAVVLAAGTARAELVTGGTVTRLAPDAAGFTVVRVPQGAAAEVRAYAADGSLLGTTPLPAAERNQEGMPGETRETRLVD